MDDLPSEVEHEIKNFVPGNRSAYLARRLAAAAAAYERDRYEEARRILQPLARDVPASSAVRELYGLTLYRSGRWKEATKELSAFYDLTESVDQHPALADCERALGRHGQVIRRFEQLRTASPSAELLAEGRLVVAGSLADQGKLREAIALLEGHTKVLRHPAPRHLRTWYALADLYERVGDIPKARGLFARVAEFDAELANAYERFLALR